MSDRIEVTASLRIARNANDVRAQYRDMDHHIRNSVHSGIKLEWLEPQAPGERRIRTTFRILGIPQSDVAVLEDLPDGTLVIRNLEGTNAGMTVYHRFIAIDDATTEVQLVADAPSTLGRKLLGPLFRAGARQVLKKALAEDKKDLEGSGFKANVAGGEVERALAEVGALSSVDAKLAVLEAACLLSMSDGSADVGERDAIARLARVIDADVGAGWIDSKLSELEKMEIATEADRIGALLAKANAGRAGVVAAAVIGLVSQGLTLGEVTALRRLGLAAGVPDDAIGPIVEAADAALDGVR